MVRWVKQGNQLFNLDTVESLEYFNGITPKLFLNYPDKQEILDLNSIDEILNFLNSERQVLNL